LGPDGTCAKHRPDKKMAIIIIGQRGILILFLHMTWKLVGGAAKAVSFPKPILETSWLCLHPQINGRLVRPSENAEIGVEERPS
jgi:hypothetical protein